MDIPRMATIYGGWNNSLSKTVLQSVLGVHIYHSNVLAPLDRRLPPVDASTCDF